MIFTDLKSLNDELKYDRRFKSISDFLRKLNMSRTLWYKKINGNSDFTIKEIRRIRELLDLTDQEVMDIFINEKNPLAELM